MGRQAHVRICAYCGAWCFAYRIVPAGWRKGWSGLMSTCKPGKEVSRQMFDGYDADNSINPVLEGRASQ